MSESAMYGSKTMSYQKLMDTRLIIKHSQAVMDDAAPGGTDALVNQPNTGTYTRSFAGLLTANQGITTVNITGLGFATSTAVSSNDATSVIVSFTYLGADGVTGGTDDVLIGSATVGFTYNSAGEYACIFDTPLTATLNITAKKLSSRCHAVECRWERFDQLQDRHAGL